MGSWVAYPSDRPRVASGTQDTRSSVQPQVYNSAFEPFETVFDHPPKVFLAINALEMDHERDMTLEVSAENVSAVGMSWHLDVWSDSILYSAGASYLAFCLMRSDFVVVLLDTPVWSCGNYFHLADIIIVQGMLD